jgi:transcriptional regulator with XRE-family HTH domain
MLNAEITVHQLACRVGVDAKSVGRWLSEDRVPYAGTRIKVAKVLDQSETYLWPMLLETPTAGDVAAAELERIWPTRTAVTSEVWHALFSRATKQLDILVYAGAFLLETLDLADIIRWKASVRTRVRLLVGDADSLAVHARAEEVDLPWLPERCRTTARYLTGIGSSDVLCVRTHATTLYASQFRFDDTLLVNAHTFGVWACQSPVYHLRKARRGYLFDYYAEAFERVWDSAR